MINEGEAQAVFDVRSNWFLKGKSAIHLPRVYGEHKRTFVVQHFCVGIHGFHRGRGETVIREYIRKQERRPTAGLAQIVK